MRANQSVTATTTAAQVVTPTRTVAPPERNGVTGIEHAGEHCRDLEEQAVALKLVGGERLIGGEASSRACEAPWVEAPEPWRVGASLDETGGAELAGDGGAGLVAAGVLVVGRRLAGHVYRVARRRSCGPRLTRFK